VAKSHSSSFDRVFPLKELFRGTALRVLLWAVVGAALLGLLVLDGFLTGDLLFRRGEISLDINQFHEYENLTTRRSNQSESNADPIFATSALNRVDQGLRATVWSMRDRPCARILAALCRAAPSLRYNSSTLAVLLLTLMACGLAYSLILSRIRTLSVRTALAVVTRLRQSIHRQTLRLGPSDLEDIQNQQVLSLFTNEMEHVRDGVYRRVSRIARHSLNLTLFIAVAIFINSYLAVQCLIPLFATWYLIQRERQRSNSTLRLAADRANSELKLLSEGLQTTRLVRGYGMEAFEQDQFQRRLERFRDKIYTAKRGERLSRWTIRLFVVICLTVIMFLVGTRCLLEADNVNHLEFSEALLLLISFCGLYRPLDQLWQLRPDEEPVRIAADRIVRYLNQIPEVGQAVGAKFLSPLSKSLHFDSVSYSTKSKQKLLDKFDLKIPAGGVTAIVSLDQLEARAVAYLLPRFIEPQLGRVLIDGEDIAWMTLESLRAETLYVGGNDPFFTGTVFENISCGNPEYSLQDITEAAKESHAHNFIQKLTQGYETVLGEHGEQLEAGQAFRLGLARATVRKPALLVVEEPTRVLDEDTKTLLDDAYNRIARGRTVIFLPSRLSTVRRAERIVLIHGGRVEAMSTHANLVKTSHLYRHWEYLRFNEFRHEE